MSLRQATAPSKEGEESPNITVVVARLWQE